MKTPLISAIAFGLFSLMAISNASAQKPRSKVLPQVTITSDNLAVSQRVIKNFSRSFTNATNVRWMQINKRYLVKFDRNDMQHNALYMKRGYRIYHIGYGFERNLPSKFQKMVRSSYGDYNISRVFDVNQDNQQVWVVNLLNQKDLVTAVIQDGELREISRNTNASSGNQLMSMAKIMNQVSDK
jgi:hypothetical protein